MGRFDSVLSGLAAAPSELLPLDAEVGNLQFGLVPSGRGSGMKRLAEARARLSRFCWFDSVDVTIVGEDGLLVAIRVVTEGALVGDSEVVLTRAPSVGAAEVR